MSTVVQPLNVSPFIKGMRWSFLIMGIFYGYTRRKMLTKREKPRIAEYKKRMMVENARIAAEKLRASIEEEEKLMKDFGSIIH